MASQHASDADISASEQPIPKQSRLKRLTKNLNFFRLHVLAFTILPLIASAVFYASNGQYHVPYIDCLFVCVSAMTVCGLGTIRMSILTGWQQAILFCLMGMGNLTFVSYIMVLVRRHYFKSHCEGILEAQQVRKLARRQSGLPRAGTEKIFARFITTPSQPIDNTPTLRRTFTYHGSDAELERPAHQEFHLPHRMPAYQSGLGGFPILTAISSFSSMVFHKVFPEKHAKLKRHLTITHETVLDKKDRPWLDFDLKTGRNSKFELEELDDDQIEELGGVEYAALNALAWIIPSYFVLTQLLAFLVIVIRLSTTSKYDQVFAEQPRMVPKAWFAAFQVLSGYTGGGLTLVDAGMVPFVGDPLITIVLLLAILSGSMCLPIFLRVIVWTLYKLSPASSELYATLSFLLAHPRRVYLYMFPSYQTWWLVASLVFLSSIEWICFVLLNHGLPLLEDLSGGQEALAGIFQSVAVRSSGFAIVSMNSIAPALQFLYVIMMYVAIYPIAMAVRSTNSYEDRSLGVYKSPKADDGSEPVPQGRNKREVFSKYLAFHLRKQLAWDLWPLIGAVWLVLVIERTKVMDDQSFRYINQFSVLFEMVSAYAGVGLSLGVNYDAFSLSGNFSTTSKLVVIAIMIRGRHRGLPVAVDRSVVLPREFTSTHKGSDPEAGEVPPTTNSSPPPSEKGIDKQAKPQGFPTVAILPRVLTMP